MFPSFPLLHLHLIIFFIFFIFLMEYIEAQNPSRTTETSIAPQDSISNFQPSLAVVIGMLSVMFSLTFILLLYAKFCHRRTSSSTPQQIQDNLLRSRPKITGLDKTVIESLPFFRFSFLKGSKEGLECSVCLSKFDDIEVLRLLPKCKHAFHINCIDQWLEKHSTCPLCRQKVSADDLSQLSYSHSLRFLWNQSEESNLELFVQREEDDNFRGCSSRFSIGSSFRKVKEDELPIQNCEEDDATPLHKFNHKIVFSDVMFQNRWSNVSSSDLMFLNSEMVDDFSSSRFSRIEQNQGIPTTSDNSETGKVLINQINDKRSMSEIIVHPRLITELRNKDSSPVEEERMRRIWLSIARKTVQWFANRERRPPPSQGLNV